MFLSLTSAYLQLFEPLRHENIRPIQDVLALFDCIYIFYRKHFRMSILGKEECNFSLIASFSAFSYCLAFLAAALLGLAFTFVWIIAFSCCSVDFSLCFF